MVSTPVLSEVFKANDLQRYTAFAKFKDAVFVLQTNRDLELLSCEYTAKLSDSKLGPVDRARLEEEFRKKRESLGSAGFSLNIRRNETLLTMPDAMLSEDYIISVDLLRTKIERILKSVVVMSEIPGHRRCA